MIEIGFCLNVLNGKKCFGLRTEKPPIVLRIANIRTNR